MRFLTKEWYRTMQNSCLGVCLEIDVRAAECSDAVFQAVWTEKLHDWLQMREEICPILEETYDETAERRCFAEAYHRELEAYRTRTPAEILTKVADLRLLALGICTEEVFAELEAYRDRCRAETERVMDEAWKMQNAQGLDKIWTGKHSLHDSVVQSMDREGEDLTVEFERDEEADWPEIGAVRFHGARILKQEQSAENAWWLYDEIWRTDGGYEVHALLWRENEVFELTVQCREPELVWTMEPKTE